MVERYKKSFQHKGIKYTAEFIKRPFREGLEVCVDVDGEVIRVAELGLGEKALIARLKYLINEYFNAAMPDRKSKL